MDCAEVHPGARHGARALECPALNEEFVTETVWDVEQTSACDERGARNLCQPLRKEQAEWVDPDCPAVRHGPIHLARIIRADIQERPRIVENGRRSGVTKIQKAAIEEHK